LQEGLQFDLLKGPAVSGAQSYQGLCLAAKNEEKRQAELRKRILYRKGDSGTPVKKSFGTPTPTVPGRRERDPSKVKKCFNCGGTDHLFRDCKEPKKESSGRLKGTVKPPTKAKMIVSEDTKENPLNYLHSSDSDNSEVCLVRVPDKGSQPRCVGVEVQGVKARGVIDTGADISIMGGELFKRVAAVERLRKKDFKPPDKTPYTYDNKPFQLDGRIDLDIVFDGKTMCTPVYVKMDSPDPLLLSEGVCRQLGIVTYNPKVEMKGERDQTTAEKGASHQSKVPLVRVCLVQSVRLRPLQSTLVAVELESSQHLKGPLLLEPTHRFEDESGELQFGNALVQPTDSRAKVLISNPTGITQKLKEGTWVGRASEAEMIVGDRLESPSEEPAQSICEDEPTCVNTVATENVEDRKYKLAEAIEEEGADLPWQERSKLHSY